MPVNQTQRDDQGDASVRTHMDKAVEWHQDSASARTIIQTHMGKAVD